MLKITYFILLLCINLGFSQTDNDYKNVLSAISEGYNAKDADKIFNLFSVDFQATFTLDKIEKFITENHTNKGTMDTSSFLLEDEGDIRYLTVFENASSIFVLRLSSDNKLTKFKLEEY